LTKDEYNANTATMEGNRLLGQARSLSNILNEGGVSVQESWGKKVWARNQMLSGRKVGGC